MLFFRKPEKKIILKPINTFADKHTLFFITARIYLGKIYRNRVAWAKYLIFQAFESRPVCVGVFVDFSKSYRPNHKSLFHKLECYSIRWTPPIATTILFKCRSQCVYIAENFSYLGKIYAGLLQRSLLCPLFLFYINDITKINGQVNFIICADDTSIFFTGTNTELLQPVINETLSELQSWSHANQWSSMQQKQKLLFFNWSDIVLCTT